MGQKRITLVDLTQGEEHQKVSQKRIAKTAGRVLKTGKRAGKLIDKSESIEAIAAESTIPEAETPQPKTEKARRVREHGRRYKLARSMVDRTINYPLDQAIELLKKTTVTRFDSTVSAHLNLTESGLVVDVPFPHSTGKKLRVAIATDALLSQVEAKTIDFDVLLATKDMMPKITKLAKILGPLGLIPNPKTGTITDNPEKRKTELESGTLQVKSESKSPLMHVVLGKLSLGPKALTENLKALIAALGPKRITKITLASTMSPGIKVDLSSFS